MSGHQIAQWQGESKIHERVVGYLKLHYSSVEFRTDFAAGIKMTKWQAAQHKRLQKRRGWPDIFIFEPRTIETALGPIAFHGMGLELKAPDARIKRLDGTWATPHLQEQADTLTKLEAKGYFCVMAVGFEQACMALNHYLNAEGRLQLDDFLIVNASGSNVQSLEEEPF